MDSPITTHVLDTSRGTPAAGITVILARYSEQGIVDIARRVTNQDGRVSDLLEPSDFNAGEYHLTFEVGQYFAAQQLESFYPRATIEFKVADPTSHYHVPLLLSPYGYSTYRGS